MIDFAKTTFGIDLNWSDESIRQIETIAAALHEDYKKKHPTPEQVAHMYRMVGSYIGEVYRKNHGAEWAGSSRQAATVFPAWRAQALGVGHGPGRKKGSSTVRKTIFGTTISTC